MGWDDWANVIQASGWDTSLINEHYIDSVLQKKYLISVHRFIVQQEIIMVILPFFPPFSSNQSLPFFVVSVYVSVR